MTLLVGRQEVHPACKKTGRWFVGGDIFDLSFARLIAPVVTSASITLGSNKIQNGDILVRASAGPPGKWPLIWRENNSFAGSAALEDVCTLLRPF